MRSLLVSAVLALSLWCYLSSPLPQQTDTYVSRLRFEEAMWQAGFVRDFVGRRFAWRWVGPEVTMAAPAAPPATPLALLQRALYAFARVAQRGPASAPEFEEEAFSEPAAIQLDEVSSAMAALAPLALPPPLGAQLDMVLGAALALPARPQRIDFLVAHTASLSEAASIAPAAADDGPAAPLVPAAEIKPPSLPITEPLMMLLGATAAATYCLFRRPTDRRRRRKLRRT